ncbi:alpha/beta fold hydrolase [Rhodohalobacter sulfatireducens]|uniref:Alpha/beta hydrolase n=1 Tax=Rhodohalobacter sulfatireducens TaxID=2911366 RepID=A0ABS9KCV3_9BACT|nr:alpha/beta hydrolase [Rhodohalobacter sulfatireducens]MCG2588685.1 alpha/beta hydrolase [Rhodohalobacter sulfatireducens]MDR9364146.1 alpha/beta hydrolase [Balneolaceae bacterium]MDR9410949.1 alpha/beta hydrolase [Balneolaceae bacterium]
MLYTKTYFNSPEKDWVVFIHGAGGSSAIWFRQVKAYREEFNVLLVDLRGHGKSKEMSSLQTYYKEKYTFKTVSKDVIETLNTNDIDRAHFVGVSLGTIIIRTIAEMEPDRVISSVMCGAITRLNTRSRILVWLGHTFKKIVPFMWLYRLFAWIIMPKKNHEESRLLFVNEAKNLARKEFLKWFRLTYDVNPLLKYFKEREMEAPTLYVMGEEDHMFLPPVKKMIKDFDHSYLVVVDGSGHVVNVEKPEKFNEVSMEFLLNHKRYLQQTG